MSLSSTIAELTLLLMKLDTAWRKIAPELTFYVLWDKIKPCGRRKCSNTYILPKIG
jgi:hypothetical protein